MMMTAESNSCLQVPDQVQDLRLHGHVQRGGRLVGDQQLRVARQRHRDHRALAHAAGELVRVVVHPRRRVRDADPVEHLDGVLARHGLADVVVDPVRLDDLVAHRVVRVHRRQRVLEDHRHVLAAQAAHRTPGSDRRGSRPSSRISPEISAVPSLCRPMIDRLVTHLPEPDSPTMPSVLPRSTWNDSPSTDFTSAVVGREVHPQVAHLEEGADVLGRLVVDVHTTERFVGNLGHEVRTLGSMTAYSRSTIRLAITMKVAANSTTPMTFGRSLLLIASHRVLAEPVERERGLGEHRAAEQQADVETEDREDRGERDRAGRA